MLTVNSPITSFTDIDGTIIHDATITARRTYRNRTMDSLSYEVVYIVNDGPSTVAHVSQETYEQMEPFARRYLAELIANADAHQ